MNLYSGTFRYDEINVVWIGKVADAGMSHISWFVSGHNVVPDAHLDQLLRLAVSRISFSSTRLWEQIRQESKPEIGRAHV